jgi:hypothetical protein
MTKPEDVAGKAEAEGSLARKAALTRIQKHLLAAMQHEAGRRLDPASVIVEANGEYTRVRLSAELMKTHGRRVGLGDGESRLPELSSRYVDVLISYFSGLNPTGISFPMQMTPDPMGRGGAFVTLTITPERLSAAIPVTAFDKRQG